MPLELQKFSILYLHLEYYFKEIVELKEFSRHYQVFHIVLNSIYSSYNVNKSCIFISQAMYRNNRINTPQGSFGTISQALCSQGITTEYLVALLPSSQRQKGNHTKDFLTHKLSKEQIAAKYGIPLHASEYTSK